MAGVPPSNNTSLVLSRQKMAKLLLPSGRLLPKGRKALRILAQLSFLRKDAICDFSHNFILPTNWCHGSTLCAKSFEHYASQAVSHGVVICSISSWDYFSWEKNPKKNTCVPPLLRVAFFRIPYLLCFPPGEMIFCSSEIIPPGD